jgi:hypothetical protein
MSLLKHVDRLAVLSILTVSLGVSAAALAGSSQALTDANVRSIKAGMPAADVLARLGPPFRKMRFEATKTTAWDYHIADAWNYDSEFSVIVDDKGIVVSKLVARLGQ